MPFSDFPVLLKLDLIFKDFSRRPSKFNYPDQEDRCPVGPDLGSNCLKMFSADNF